MTLGAITLSVGCQPNPKVQTQVDYRVEGMSWTAQHWVRSEQRCPEKFARTVDHAGRSIEWHGERLGLMLHRVADWQRRDRERFIKRQPAYQQKGADILWGKPEQAEDIAIRLLF